MLNTTLFDHYDANENGDCASLQRCLRMIEMHAPRLMRAGGGSLRAEEKPRSAISAEIKRKVCAAYLDLGRPAHIKLAELFGVGESTVGQILRAAGIRTGAGYHSNHVPTKSRQGRKGFIASNPAALLAAAEEFNAMPARWGGLKYVACKYGLNDSSVYSKARALREKAAKAKETHVAA